MDSHQHRPESKSTESTVKYLNHLAIITQAAQISPYLIDLNNDDTLRYWTDRAEQNTQQVLEAQASKDETLQAFAYLAEKKGQTLPVQIKGNDVVITGNGVEFKVGSYYESKIENQLNKEEQVPSSEFAILNIQDAKCTAENLIKFLDSEEMQSVQAIIMPETPYDLALFKKLSENGYSIFYIHIAFRKNESKGGLSIVYRGRPPSKEFLIKPYLFGFSPWKACEGPGTTAMFNSIVFPVIYNGKIRYAVGDHQPAPAQRVERLPHNSSLVNPIYINSAKPNEQILFSGGDRNFYGVDTARFDEYGNPIAALSQAKKFKGPIVEMVWNGLISRVPGLDGLDNNLTEINQISKYISLVSNGEYRLVVPRYRGGNKIPTFTGNNYFDESKGLNSIIAGASNLALDNFTVQRDNRTIMEVMEATVLIENSNGQLESVPITDHKVVKIRLVPVNILN